MLVTTPNSGTLRGVGVSKLPNQKKPGEQARADSAALCLILDRSHQLDSGNLATQLREKIPSGNGEREGG